jgi:hypothetical protein
MAGFISVIANAIGRAYLADMNLGLSFWGMVGDDLFFRTFK